MKRVLTILLIGVLGLAVYAIVSAPRLVATPAPASQPVATNLIGGGSDPFAWSPCIFPTTAQLAELAGFSDLVVVGTVEGAAQVVTPPGIKQQFTRYTLQVSSVLRGPSASGVLTIMESGGVVHPILSPGPQIVFLFSDGPGTGTYTVTDGFAGIFLTRSTGMTRECPHGANPSVFVSDGSSEAAFSAEIQGLTPTRPPHK